MRSLASFLLRCLSFADLIRLALLLLLACLCRGATSGPSCEWTLLFLSPNRVKTFLSLGPSLVNIVAFTGLLRQVGLSPSCHSLEKALVFCEGRVSLDAVTGLGLLFLVLLFMSHDLDSENLVCEFRCELSPCNVGGSHTVRSVWTTSYIDECRCRRIFLGYCYHRLLSVFGMLTFFLDSLCLVSYSFDLVTGGRPSWSDTQSCAESIPCGVVGLFATVCMSFISEDDCGDDGEDENVFIIGERVESFKDKDSWESYHELFNPFVGGQGMFVDVENSKVEMT
ncbi:hypothetical protein Tco_0598315 [Tanacetum coccineum]